ncbi:hypothetical protein [Pajaroellobacter abortibovis]|uniref:Uncharacterized protein n=1 Tax=Pajaroellobacter abortibovis TaxID=1882918 RepID=A0A1L6MWN3_9BACT|nr:hypothetical protein [Pajaroellobacter abortibovis]APR99946.1 hypothetical protein BCY86_04060 [Pajaroellobacter abortibovis]
MEDVLFTLAELLAGAKNSNLGACASNASYIVGTGACSATIEWVGPVVQWVRDAGVSKEQVPYGFRCMMNEGN